MAKVISTTWIEQATSIAKIGEGALWRYGTLETSHEGHLRSDQIGKSMKATRSAAAIICHH